MSKRVEVIQQCGDRDFPDAVALDGKVLGFLTDGGARLFARLLRERYERVTRTEIRRLTDRIRIPGPDNATEPSEGDEVRCG